MSNHSENFLNLAIIETGEALTALGTLRQRGVVAGDPAFVPVAEKLRRAAHALSGAVYPQIVDPRHAELGKKGS